MRRFIYAPEVTAYIKSDEVNKVFDVSKDIVSGEVSRRLDAVSTATLVLQNKFGLYTRKFKPMDRIAIFMRRIGDPMLVFTGYVDEAPFYQMFPAPVTIQCSCPLKLLQNTYFDPGLPFMTQWFKKFGWIYDPASGKVTAPFGGFANYDSKDTNSKFSDGNLARLITAALIDIAGWPREHIFIRSIPNDFKKTLHYLMKAEAIEYQEDYTHMVNTMAALLGVGTSEDPTNSAALPTFTGGNVSGPQLAAYASHAGFRGDNLTIAVALAMAESSGQSDAMNYNTNGTYDVGCWQINTVHTSGGGGGLPAPPGGVGTLHMPKDFNAVKGNLPSGVRSFMEACEDPTFNAHQAYNISQGGTSFSPWATYTSGRYRDYMAEAAKAVKQFRSGKGTSTNDSNTPPQLAGPPGSPQSGGDTQWQDTSTSKGGKGGKTVAKFIDFCKKALGTPYVFGGQDPFHGGADCSGFVHYMYQHYWGINLPPPTFSQVKQGTHVDKADLRPGDLAFFYPQANGPDHVGIYIGNGKVIHDPHTGSSVQIVPLDSMPYVEGRRVLDGVSMGDTGAQTPQGQAVQNEQAAAATARVAAWFQLPTVDSTLSLALSGNRALANDIPLFEWIQQICKGGGRRFTTMPNGDFLAFFPDYFNDFNRTPYFIVRPIEIIDLQIQVSDRSLVTHVFASGSSYSPQQVLLQDQLISMIASVQEPAFNMFINIDDQATKTVIERKGKKKSKKKTTELNVWKGANKFLKRYGARPLPISLPDIRNPVLLWMAAWFEFQKNWASQFGCTASFTFMPEILPGGIINLDNKITMFVESVTHSFDLEQGFSTTAELTSPAAVNKNDKRFGGMVLAGGNFGVAQAVAEDSSIAKDAGPSGGGNP